MFAFAFGEIARYLGFLGVVARRHRRVSRRVGENTKAFQATVQEGNHPLTAHQLKLHQTAVILILELQLETESYYLFAKILLDKIARAIEFYFGAIQNCALDSHDDFVKRLDRYTAAKKLKAPDEFKETINELKRDVSDFRDYQIAHEKSPRTMRGISWDQAGNVTMSVMKLYPKETDKHVESKAIADLEKSIGKYCVWRNVISNSVNEKTKVKSS